MAERDIIINPGDFPGNSNKDKEQAKRPKQEKSIQSKVVKSKPSIFKKAAGIFFKDAADEDDLKATIIFDYLIPTMKDTIVEMGKMLLEGIFYGSTSSRKHSSSSGPYKTSYSDYYDSNKKTNSKTQKHITSRNFYDYEFIPDENMTRKDAYDDANETIHKLIDIATGYKYATVSDFCDIVGIDDEWTSNKYGWYVEDLIKADIVGTSKGWKIIFTDPRVVEK